MQNSAQRSLAIRNEALRLGFSACGFAKAEPLEEDRKRLGHWLDAGYNGSMEYMENHFEKRTDPTQLVEGSISVISLLMNYYTEQKQSDPLAPVLSKYAFGTDYHFVMKERMKKLLQFIQDQFGEVSGRVFVDSAPLLDRAWARKAGLGWIGKNSNLINRNLGSFVFIGELLVDLELECNSIPESDFCGACAACIEACPTDAILEERTIDSSRCISYLTIENRGEIPETFKGKMENRAFGCDICQDVCPWNRKSIPHSIPEFDPSYALMEMDAEGWYKLDKLRFNALFKNSPVKRSRYEGLMRNLNFLSADL